MSKNVKEMDMLDIVMELEGGEIVCNNLEDLQYVVNTVRPLSVSQGSYGRFCHRMDMAMEQGDIEFPIRL